MEQKQWWMQPGTICIVVGLLGALIYLPTLQFGYVNLDDPWLIKNNTLLQQANLSTLHSVWFDLSTAQRLRLGGEYLPVRDMSVMLDFLMFSVGGAFSAMLAGALCDAFDSPVAGAWATTILAAVVWGVCFRLSRRARTEDGEAVG